MGTTITWLDIDYVHENGSTDKIQRILQLEDSDLATTPSRARINEVLDDDLEWAHSGREYDEKDYRSGWSIASWAIRQEEMSA